jgi:hypothetical protein
MTDLLIILVGVSNLVGQWFWCSLLLKAMSHNVHLTKPSIEPQITRTHPDLTNTNAIGQGDSVIVEPKSPQLVQWEEEEQVRKLNLKPR